MNSAIGFILTVIVNVTKASFTLYTITMNFHCTRFKHNLCFISYTIPNRNSSRICFMHKNKVLSWFFFLAGRGINQWELCSNNFTTLVHSIDDLFQECETNSSKCRVVTDVIVLNGVLIEIPRRERI
uniref:Uncharacterized protein n=1 Tax=Cacopsylla melanoneura TaxID=428564 RepID=A0A8D9BW20_9HEMI